MTITIERQADGLFRLLVRGDDTSVTYNSLDNVEVVFLVRALLDET